METERACTLCKIVKPFNEFRKNKKGKYGIDAQCKKCRYEKFAKPYYEANKEKCHANASKWAKNNREKINSRIREDYAKNPEKYRERDKSNRENIQKRNREYRKRHPQKIRAQNILRDHVKRGNITKPDKCSFCDNTNWIEAHHPDYEKPLEVIWVCRQCHVKIHKMVESHGHRERPSLEAPQGDAMVRTCEETAREEV